MLKPVQHDATSRYGDAMSQFDLTDEQRRIREMARAFTADAITPHAAARDEKHAFPSGSILAAAVTFGKRS